MFNIHLFESSGNNGIHIVEDMCHEGREITLPVEVKAKRSWPILINLLQTEDESGYGSQFYPIPKFMAQDESPVLTWCLFSLFASCKELWKLVDLKDNGFRTGSWEGWLLTAVSEFCFPFHLISIDTKSPFKKLSTYSNIINKIRRAVSSVQQQNELPANSSFYGLGKEYFEFLFADSYYASLVAVLSDSHDIIDHQNKKAYIVVSNKPPETDVYTVGNSKTIELRVVCVVKANRSDNSSSKFDGIRYMRHGNGFKEWWKQERKDNVTTKCTMNRDSVFRDFTEENEDIFLQYVSLYIRQEDENSDHLRDEVFKSMGGKTHVKCKKCNFPMIPSFKPKEKKDLCNVQCIEVGGVERQTNQACQRKESYICSTPGCNVKICARCYNVLPKDRVSSISSSSNSNNLTTSNAQQNSEQMDANDTNDENDRVLDLRDVANPNDDFGGSDDDRTFYSEASDDVGSNNEDDYDEDNYFESFITSSEQDVTLDITEDNIDEDGAFFATDSGNLPVNVRDSNINDEVVSGHVIFNQIGSCTQRRQHTITGTSRQRHFTQGLAATTKGTSSPILQPVASLYPRHFYAAAEHDKCAILGAEPIFTLTGKKHAYGFASTLAQARIHMTSASSTTASDMDLMCYYFDLLGNKLLSNCHSRDLFKRGFVCDNKSPTGLGVRDKEYTDLSQSVDSRKMVMNLSTSQKYIKYTWFLTFTLNQMLHPGLRHLHAWKESTGWTKNIPGYESMTPQQKEEIKLAMEKAYGVHIFENWNAVKFLLLCHFRDHLTVLGTTTAIFARDEYQNDSGNLCHNHLILAIDKSSMGEDSEKYIQDLIRTSVFEIVKTDEDLQRMIESGLLKSVTDIPQVTTHASIVLPHVCDQRCKVRIGSGDTEDDKRCRKQHPVKDSPDPSSHNYIPFNFKFQDHTLEILEQIGLYSSETKEFHHPYFDPKRHMAPCMTNATCNMSPVIPDYFVAFRSMQNAQALDHTNGVAKYVVKYISKFDEGNYVVLCQDIHTGEWVLGKHHLHNTKIVTSKYNEEKAFDKTRFKTHPKGRDMPHFEIRQILLGIPEVLTNMDFIPLSTLPFELRPVNATATNNSSATNNTGSHANTNNNNNNNENHPPDSFSSSVPSQRARVDSNIEPVWHMTDNQMATYRNNDGKAHKYDKISQFSLRPPELLKVFTNPIDYYRYCQIDKKQMNFDEITQVLSSNLNKRVWVDGLGRKVMIRSKGVSEINEICQKNITRFQAENDNDGVKINEIVSSMCKYFDLPDENLSTQQKEWLHNDCIGKFIDVDDPDLLPIPVVSNTDPKNALNFLIHIILSLGHYETEIDALTHSSFQESLRNAGLIGGNTDEQSLKKYSEKLTRLYIEEQLVFFPNSLMRAETYILMAKRVFDDAIIHNALSINEIPPFTMVSLRQKEQHKCDNFWKDTIQSQLQSVYSTLSSTNGIPTVEDVTTATRDDPLQWNPTETLEKYDLQSDESYEEQIHAINVFSKQLNKYRDTSGENSLTLTKNTVAYGAPGTGKSFIAQLVVLYAISQGLNVMTTALMGVRANVLGGIHLHKIFMFSPDGIIRSPFKSAEQAVISIERNNEINFMLKTIDVLFIDELGQVSAEQLQTIDLILRRIRKSQIPFGGVLILGTMDHTQLQPIKELPILTSSFMLTCFQMVSLEHSVRAHGDPDFQRLQAITRMNPVLLQSSEALKNEFFNLAEKLTYVSDWNDPRIGPNMMRAFARIIPAQEALDEARNSLRRQLESESVDFCTSSSNDTHRIRSSNAEFTPASEDSIKSLNKAMKEPSEIIFFAGGVYECTVNDTQNRKYSQSQLAFMRELPSQETIDHFNAIPLWIAPPGTDHIPFDHNNIPSREYLISKGWKEVHIGVSPERLILVRGGFQAKRLQYSLKHIGAITINKSQGATLPLGIAVEITRQYSPWEKGQIVVLLSRTTTSSQTIIVGDKNYAIQKMWELISVGNQWTTYSEHILKCITVNRETENGSINRTDENQSLFDYPQVYPFQICNIDIPTDRTGYVYCLVSRRNHSKIYIGETECLSQRIQQHNSGNGSNGTRDIRDMPWGIAAFICGLNHVSKRGRMSIERNWKVLVEQ